MTFFLPKLTLCFFPSPPLFFKEKVCLDRQGFSMVEKSRGVMGWFGKYMKFVSSFLIFPGVCHCSVLYRGVYCTTRFYPCATDNNPCLNKYALFYTQFMGKIPCILGIVQRPLGYQNDFKVG